MYDNDSSDLCVLDEVRALEARNLGDIENCPRTAPEPCIKDGIVLGV
jgi:hypothetical protein